jgi:AhpD family alkylhydroperoxidase
MRFRYTIKMIGIGMFLLTCSYAYAGETEIKDTSKSESQIQLNKDRKEQLRQLMEISPALNQLFPGKMEATFKDGAIDGKTKHLMAMAMALGIGCRNCVLAHTEAALNLGATKEEIFESISVVFSMRGTTGVGESLRVIQFLDELGKL